MRAVRLLMLLGFMAAPRMAAARAQSDLHYSQGEVFSTAVRFIVIERKCKVTDKDADAAFVNFECQDDGKVKRGSVEIFGTPGEKTQRSVRVQVTLGDDPHYMESRFLELFERKLRDERGNPPPPISTRPERRPPPDAGSP